MTAAPRGIDRTKSTSNGRRARYWVPLVALTTLPSGAPMSASCWMAPRWVWNCLPGSRVTVCRRPFESDSCTRSPWRNGPDPGAALTPSLRSGGEARCSMAIWPARSRSPLQLLDEVSSGDDSGRAAVGVQHEVLARGGGADPVEQRVPIEVLGQRQAVLERAGDGGDRRPRAALGWDGADARLVHDRGRAVAGVHEDEPAGVRPPGPLEGLGDGEPGRHEHPRTQQPVDGQPRHPVDDLGDLHRVAGGEPEVAGDGGGEQTAGQPDRAPVDEEPDHEDDHRDRPPAPGRDLRRAKR